MPLITAVERQIGTPSRQREVMGAAVLLLGSVAVAVCTGVFGFALYADLAVLGAAATLAWLVDGTAGRYVGAGTVALAIGGGLTLGRDLHVPGYEHMVVFGFIGLALLVISYINPKAVRGTAALLMFIAATVAALEYLASYTAGWELTGILAVWGLLELGRISRAGGVPDGGTGALDQGAVGSSATSADRLVKTGLAPERSTVSSQA